MYVLSAQPGTTVAGAAGVGETAGTTVAGVGEAAGCGDGDGSCVESRGEAKGDNATKC